MRDVRQSAEREIRISIQTNIFYKDEGVLKNKVWHDRQKKDHLLIRN
jgi:hypothetical protein